MKYLYVRVYPYILSGILNDGLIVVVYSPVLLSGAAQSQAHPQMNSTACPSTHSFFKEFSENLMVPQLIFYETSKETSSIKNRSVICWVNICSVKMLKYPKGVVRMKCKPLLSLSLAFMFGFFLCSMSTTMMSYAMFLKTVKETLPKAPIMK